MQRIYKEKIPISVRMIIFSFFDYFNLAKAVALSKRDYTYVTKTEYIEKTRNITILMDDLYEGLGEVHTYNGSLDAIMTFSSKNRTIPSRCLINLVKTIYLRLSNIEEAKLLQQIFDLQKFGDKKMFLEITNVSKKFLRWINK
jgi:hypothetical protein